MTTVADRLYAALKPLAYDDEGQGGALRLLVDAIGVMFQQVSTLAEDAGVHPGWSLLYDVDRAPAYALPWLGQFVGVTVDATLDDAAQRQQIRAEGGMARGTLASIAAAAQRTLTGTRTVVIRERDDDACPTEPAYGLTVITFATETPDPAVTETDVRSQKPAGIVLQFLVETGQDFETVRENFATFDDLTSTYTTFDAMRTDTP